MKQLYSTFADHECDGNLITVKFETCKLANTPYGPHCAPVLPTLAWLQVAWWYYFVMACKNMKTNPPRHHHHHYYTTATAKRFASMAQRPPVCEKHFLLDV